MRHGCEVDPQVGADTSTIHGHSGNLGSTLSSCVLEKHPRPQKSSDTSNKHIKTTDNDDNLPCQGCGRYNHRRETCDLRDHPDFNRYGDWIGSATEVAIRAFVRATSPDREVPNRDKLFKHLRADGMKIPKTSQQRPFTPPKYSNTRRDRDDRDRSGRGEVLDDAAGILDNKATVAGSLLTKAFIREMVRIISPTLLHHLLLCDHSPLTSVH